MIQKAQIQYVSRGRSAGWAARPALRPALLVLLVALATLAVLAVGGAREAGAQEQVAPNGRVVAWGDNIAGQTDVPAAAQGGVKAVAAGAYHSLAVVGDLAAPGAVELLEADAGEGRVSLSWINPTDSDLEAVRVLRSTSGFATSPEPDADQNRVYEGTGESFADTNLSNGTTYYYTAYTRDGSGNWSARSIRRATPTAASAPNDPPAATDDAVTTDRGKAVEIDVLANDTDPDGDTLTLSRFSQPDNGTADCAESGVCTYTPKEGFTGADRFAYLMSDGRGGSDFATVRVTVRDATAPASPVITVPANDSYDTDGNITFSGTAEQGATVKLYEGAAQRGVTATADTTTGAWKVSLTGVANGKHVYSARATDAAGNASAPSATRTVTVDRIKPYVARTIPANGAARVAPTANVTAIFSEAMAPASVNRTTVKLVRAGTSVVVPATVTYNATTKTATLNPSRSLVKGARYTATVTVGAKDAAGNALDQSVTLAGAQPKTWSFTVAN